MCLLQFNLRGSCIIEAFTFDIQLCQTIWADENKYKLPFPGGKVHFKFFYNKWDMPASQSTGVHER